MTYKLHDELLGPGELIQADKAHKLSLKKKLKRAVAEAVAGVHHTHLQQFTVVEEREQAEGHAKALKTLKSSIANHVDGIRFPSKGTASATSLRAWFVPRPSPSRPSSACSSSASTSVSTSASTCASTIAPPAYNVCAAVEGPASEAEIVTKQLLATVYDRQLKDSEVLAVLSLCPEVGWLAECFCQAPLPPGWRKSKIAPGDTPLYACESTGSVSEAPPCYMHFARLAEAVVHRRQSLTMAEATPGWVRAVADEARSLADGLRATWTGPHFDPASGAEYFACLATGVSTWENPCSWVVFVSCVAERLLQSDAFARESPQESPRQPEAEPSEVGEEATRASNEPPSVWAALDELAAAHETEAPVPGQAWAAIEEQIAAQPRGAFVRSRAAVPQDNSVDPENQAHGQCAPQLRAPRLPAVPSQDQNLDSGLQARHKCAPQPQPQGLPELAQRLQEHSADSGGAALREVLEAIERVPVTVKDLKETRLGVLTQPFKDSPDKDVRAVAKRLRRAWKDLLTNSSTNA